MNFRVEDKVRREQFRAELQERASEEEINCRQKSSIKKGDNNTFFFHMFANRRKKRNIITSLQTEGEENSDKEATEKKMLTTFGILTQRNP